MLSSSASALVLCCVAIAFPALCALGLLLNKFFWKVCFGFVFWTSMSTLVLFCGSGNVFAPGLLVLCVSVLEQCSKVGF